MIDLSKLSNPFPQESVHWRAQSVHKDKKGNGYYCLALAYLDARDVMDRLDQVCGPDNWQSEHFDCGGGKLGCRIGIRIQPTIVDTNTGTVAVNADWVWKSDGAGDTQFEAEKGAFSGALKRAGVSWGIGRYLYDLGNTYVPCEAYERNGKPVFRRFTVDPWTKVKNKALFLPRRMGADVPTQQNGRAAADVYFEATQEIIRSHVGTQDELRTWWKEQHGERIDNDLSQEQINMLLDTMRVKFDLDDAAQNGREIV